MTSVGRQPPALVRHTFLSVQQGLRQPVGPRDLRYPSEPRFGAFEEVAAPENGSKDQIKRWISQKREREREKEKIMEGNKKYVLMVAIASTQRRKDVTMQQCKEL